MTALYLAYNHSLHCASDWKYGFSQDNSTKTLNCSSSLNFQWGLDMQSPSMQLSTTVLLFEATLHLPCAVSLAGEVIPCRVAHIPFFQSLELLHSSARAVTIFWTLESHLTDRNFTA